MSTPAPQHQAPTSLEELVFFLEAASRAEPGWSDPYGGPEGVARTAPYILERLRAEITALRSAALGELTRDRPAGQVAADLGVTRQTVHKLLHSEHARTMTW